MRPARTSNWSPSSHRTREAQFDEKWACVAKQQANGDPADLSKGDHWVRVAIDLDQWLIISVVPGKSRSGLRSFDPIFVRKATQLPIWFPVLRLENRKPDLSLDQHRPSDSRDVLETEQRTEEGSFNIPVRRRKRGAGQTLICFHAVLRIPRLATDSHEFPPSNPAYSVHRAISSDANCLCKRS
jgi:hypothetical protein